MSLTCGNIKINCTLIKKKLLPSHKAEYSAINESFCKIPHIRIKECDVEPTDCCSTDVYHVFKRSSVNRFNNSTKTVHLGCGPVTIYTRDKV